MQKVGYGLLEHNQHLLLVDFVVLIQIGIFDELPHLHHVHSPLLPQEPQRVLKQIEQLEILQPAVGVDVVLLEDLIHCLP